MVSLWLYRLKKIQGHVRNPFLYIQLGLILIACFFSQGHFHFDEHFQILEFLNFKLGNVESTQLPWEFAAQIRPWGQVFIYFIITKFLAFLNVTDPFTLPIFFRFATAGLAITALLLTIKFIQRKSPHQLFFPIILTLWFWPFLAARISSECFNGLLFYNCILFYLLQVSSLRSAKFVIFFVMLAAVWGRVQLAPSLLGFCLWAYFIERSLRGHLLLMLCAFMAATMLNLTIDFWGYNSWTLTPWNYFYQNLLAHRASNFGVSAWYSYFPWLITKSGNPIAGLAVLSALFFLWLRRPTSLVTWITLPFILLHMLFGHKELRFLFPMAFFIPIILLEVCGPLLKLKYAAGIASIFIALNLFTGLILALRPATPLIAIYKSMATRPTPAAKLYYFGGENPLRPGDLPISWYRTPNIQTINIKSIDEIPAPELSWVFTDRFLRGQELAQKHTCTKLSKSNFEFFYDLVPAKIMTKTRIFNLWECQVIGT